MEPQEYNYFKKDNCKCLGIVMAILLALTIGAIGLILGTIFAGALLASLPVLIATAIILGIILILTIIYKQCACDKGKKKGC